MTEPNELEEAKQWSEREIGDIILIAGTKLDGLKFMLYEPTRWVLLREVLAAYASHRNAALVKRVGELEQALPGDIRAAGWDVAVHNDYRINGRAHPFWLFTKGDRCVKGEGATDAFALNQVRAALAWDKQAADSTAERKA